jgi:hypothetical protein
VKRIALVVLGVLALTGTAWALEETWKYDMNAGTHVLRNLPAPTQATNPVRLQDTFTSSVNGVAPASGGGSTNFLRADGTWAAPPASGGTVTTVTGTAPIFITSTPTTTPNVTIQGAVTTGGTSTSATSLGALASGVLTHAVSAGVSTPGVFAATATRVTFGSGTAGGLADDAEFTYDAVNNRLGIGTAAPANNLNVVASGSAAIATIDSYHTAGLNIPILWTRAATGSAASPGNVATSDIFGEIVGGGYAGGAFRNVAAMNFQVASGTISGTSLPARIYWETTPDGSVTRTERASIESDGAFRVVALGTAGGGHVSAANTTGQFSVSATIPYADISGAPAAITSLTTDVTATGPGAAVATIANDAVTLAKITNFITDSFPCRDTAGTGDLEVCAIGGGLEFTGGPGIQTSAFTGDATKAAGGTALTLATVNSNVGSFTNASITVNGKGLITAASSGATPAPVGATYITQTADATLTGEQAIGALVTGVLSGATTTGVVSSTAFTAGSIAFGASSILSQDNANLFWDNGNDRLGIGTAAPAFQLHMVKDGGAVFFAADTYATSPSNQPIFFFRSAQGSAASPANVALSDYLMEIVGGGYAGGAFRNTAGINFQIASSGTISATSLPTRMYFETTPDGSVTRTERLSIEADGTVRLPTANAGSISEAFTLAGQQNIEKQGSGNFYIGTLGAQLLGFYTSNSTRMSIDGTTGGVTLSSLAGSGTRVVSASSAGLLGIASSAEVAAAITWPANNQILVSTGTTTAPDGSAGLLFDAGDDQLIIGAGSSWIHNNLGSGEGGTFEGVRAQWISNVWTLSSLASGGTVRSMTIDADTATLTAKAGSSARLELAGGTTANNFLRGVTTNDLFIDDWSDIVMYGGNGVSVQSGEASVVVGIGTNTINVDANGVVASAANAAFNGISLDANPTITGTTAITNTSGFNAVSIEQPTYSTTGAGVTVTHAASLYVGAAPTTGANVTITNPYAFWVDSGRARFDGDGTHVFELPADATGNTSAATGRIPILVGGNTRYIRYYTD